MTVGALAARPFYHEFAWAYDLLVARPVAEECAGMTAWLARRGVRPPAAVLDAGCGTGRHAVELARLGFTVTGVDRSPELLAEAAARAREAGLPIALVEADLLALPAGQLYDSVVCRGVLNDVIGARDRAAVLDGFARVLRPGGVLLLDVRDWDLTAARKTADPVTDKRVATPRGALVFRSVTRLDPAARRLLVSERHALATPSGERIATHDFVMQCWTRDELAAGLAAAGFDSVEYAAAYPGTPGRGLEDRIVAAASRRAR
jgi:ubiquinone/menaquinone biosynthesis C-methylase UbiE